MKNSDLQELLKIVDTQMLKQWILDYTKENPDFGKKMIETLNPTSIKETALKDYPELIRTAFNNHPIKFGNRYRGYDYEGFEAEDVRADLEKVLDDVVFFLSHRNIKAVVHICKCMIEIIPEEWDEQFDYDGDVQVMYDEAIDYLENILEENLLSSPEKKELFDWYKNESEILEKHDNIGLNTDFAVLQKYFLSSEEMVEANLKLTNERILNAKEDYDKERWIMRKLEILSNADRFSERESVIEEHLKYVKVRKIKLEKLMEEGAYIEAMDLIHEGIEIAEQKRHAGTVSDWKDALLQVYLAQRDHLKILAMAEYLFFNGREQEKYYQILRSETPKEKWLETVERIIIKTSAEKGFWGFNYFRAKILIEHQRWELLFKQCEVGHEITYFEEFEKYLRPLFDKELVEIYVEYIEKEAKITNQNSYENVARILKKLKTFPGGSERAKKLVDEYREVYKRRRNMMRELEGV